MSTNKFKNYKQVETWLKERTKKEFFITCTKGNEIKVVITRDNKLKIYSTRVGYWSWFTETSALKMLDFIEQ